MLLVDKKKAEECETQRRRVKTKTIETEDEGGERTKDDDEDDDAEKWKFLWCFRGHGWMNEMGNCSRKYQPTFRQKENKAPKDSQLDP